MSTTAPIRILNRNRDARDLTDLRMPFRNKTGSLTGELVTLPEGAASPCVLPGGQPALLMHRDGVEAFTPLGNLPTPFRHLLAGQITDGAGRTLYVVRSYGTVIAWSFDGPSVTPYQPPRERPGRVWIPNVRHTETTSGHQHVILQARGAEWHTIAGAAVA